jgi:MFS family permease
VQGPFIGGALSSAGQWRWTFWLTTIFGAVCLVTDHFILPLKPVSGSIAKKLGQIDYLGIFLSAAATVLLLVPISGGGTTFAWSSPTAIALLVVGALCAVGFIVSQWKYARLPILPRELRVQACSD